MASWEKEDGWETVGDINVVTLRWLIVIPFTIIIIILKEGGYLLCDWAKRRRKDDFPSKNVLVDWEGSLQEIWWAAPY